MEREKKDKKMEEIRVLDKGENMDDGPILMAFCCGGVFIPFRMR